MSALPPTIDSPIFNSSFFIASNDYLTITTGDQRYLRLGGVGTLSALAVSGNIDGGSLSLGGSNVDLTLLSGVIAGTPAAGKVLSLDGSSQLAGSLTLTGSITSPSVFANTIIRTTRTTNGQSFSSINGTSTCALYHFNNADVFWGTTSAHNLNLQTNNVSRMLINGTTGNITGISSLSSNTLIVGTGNLRFTSATNRSVLRTSTIAFSNGIEIYDDQFSSLPLINFKTGNQTNPHFMQFCSFSNDNNGSGAYPTSGCPFEIDQLLNVSSDSGLRLSCIN
jgi:hypothetical protein